jgi:arylformamidase
LALSPLPDMLFVLVAACTPPPLLDQQYRELPCVEENLLSLDLYPLEQPAPLLVWVHGGAWRSGDKTRDMDDKRRLARHSGYALASLNYRLSDPDDFGQPTHLFHPVHVQDVAAALGWLHRNAERLGVDGERMVLMGPSAGAHLVALVVTNTEFLEGEGVDPAIVRGVASYDVEAYDLPARMSLPDRDALFSAFGKDPVVWEHASPIYHLRPGLPPFQLVCRGDEQRLAFCHDFAEKLEAEGTDVDILDGSALHHTEVADVVGERSDRILTPGVEDFLARCRAD